jgi:hypothetical protein
VRILVVDAANVVGSRPDGWWHDRAGAARRLQEQLASADLPYDEIVLVLEGRARGASEAGRAGRVRTVHAAGSGDDAIVAAVRASSTAERGHDLDVVTADRGLRARVEDAGAGIKSPTWLLAQL